VVGKADLSRFSTSARIAAEWTADILDFDERKYLAELPLKIEVGDVCLVHASPREPKSWEYLNFKSMLPGQFATFDGKICFVGHSHKPLIWNDFGEKIIPDNRAAFALDEGTRYFVNAGSVGQPRDGDPRTGYILFDDVKSEITFFRLNYDIERAVSELKKNGLPERLASRLYRGF
ncbi:MAG: metallophosphoesterase family protein, partial [bacterium]